MASYLDDSQMLIVGGRIQNSELAFEFKQNPLSHLIFLDAYFKTLHGGLNQMQSYVQC